MVRFLIVPLAALTLAAPALADPPAHAPAHGYRDKAAKKQKHRGYTGVEWVEDYGVSAGRCNTDAVLTAIGAVGGAVIGHQLASPENRTIATLAGALVGGIIGKQVGDAIDDRDRACMGHTLEIAPVGRAVVWKNPRSNLSYTLRPLRDLPGGCRLFEYQVDGSGKRSEVMTACRSQAGTWTVRKA